MWNHSSEASRSAEPEEASASAPIANPQWDQAAEQINGLAARLGVPPLAEGEYADLVFITGGSDKQRFDVFRMLNAALARIDEATAPSGVCPKCGATFCRRGGFEETTLMGWNHSSEASMQRSRRRTKPPTPRTLLKADLVRGGFYAFDTPSGLWQVWDGREESPNGTRWLGPFPSLAAVVSFIGGAIEREAARKAEAAG